MSDAPHLIAYQVEAEPLDIVPAARGRAWMDATHQHFATRCLPMMIANAAGWWLLHNLSCTVHWNGAAGLDDLRIFYAPGDGPWRAESHFGHGILTFRVPYLFRTSPGWELLVKGPANLPKDGIAPLEGIVETDWAVQTFTMNWQMTRPGSVSFLAGEPFCQLLPIRRGDLEAIEPSIRPLGADPQLYADYDAWRQSRQQFNAELKDPTSQAARDRWQKHYVRGTSPTGISAPPREHRTALKIRPFVRYDDPDS